MERSLKILSRLIVIIIFITILIAILKYIDTKYFDGFWSYMHTKPRRINSEYWISKKPEYIKYSHYLKGLNTLVSLGFIGVLLSSVLYSVIWKFKISKYKKSEK